MGVRAVAGEDGDGNENASKSEHDNGDESGVKLDSGLGSGSYWLKVRKDVGWRRWRMRERGMPQTPLMRMGSWHWRWHWKWYWQSA